MEYVSLGKTNLRVSRLGFGGIPIQRIDAEGTKALMQQLLEKGVNYIDTARGYTVSEEYLGFALEGVRDQFVLATKSMARTREDMEKDIDQTYDYSHVTKEKVEECLTHFVGTIEQVPPVFSACKVQGRRAYEMARTGEEVQLKAKTLVIDEIELLQYTQGSETQRPSATIRVVCSKGTYIRALARDIGEYLHCGAYLTALQRTRVGDFHLDQCLDIIEFKNNIIQRSYETVEI